jgi:hypothetical protein
MPGGANLTFALSAKNEDFSPGFPRSQRRSADRDAKDAVVETYPLESRAAKLR